MQISRFNFTPVHVRGQDNFVSDALSRLFSTNKDVKKDVIEENRSDSDSVTLLNILFHCNPQGHLSIREAQKLSEYCSHIYADNKSGQNENFFIRDGLLCRFVGKNRNRRIVLPESMIEFLLNYFHSNIHFGTSKTFRDISKRFWIPNLLKIVKKFICKCEMCATSKLSNSPKAPNLALLPPELNETLVTIIC